MKDFLDVLIENHQAQIAGFYNDDKTDAEREKRNAVIEEYQDLIAIYKANYSAAPSPPSPVGIDTPWPLTDVLKRLVDAAEILLNIKDYDGPDWEEIGHSVKAAKEYLQTLPAALTPQSLGIDVDALAYNYANDIIGHVSELKDVSDECDWADIKDAFKAGYATSHPQSSTEEEKDLWHDVKDGLPEEIDTCFWCKVPTVEPPYVGSMCDSDFPGVKYFTHYRVILNSFFPKQ